MSLLTVTKTAVQLGGRTVLHGIDFAIKPGEIVPIAGPNGSGKTTFLRLLVGAIQATSGTIARKPGLTIGYVPQRLAIDRTMPVTVDRFLNLPIRRDRAAIAETLILTGLEGIEGRQLTALSGGQFQRALLARALLGQPDLLVLDEPTQGLDQQGEAAFYSLLETVRQDTGCAVLLVSHDLHVVMRASDRVICVNGHICCQGAPTVVSEAPEYRALFGLGSQGALALYRHDHDHTHDDNHAHTHGRTPLKMPPMLGVLAHTALALGLVATSLVAGAQIDLMAFLIGDILAVGTVDLTITWGGSGLVLALLAWRWRALLTATLNADLAFASGLPPRREELVLTLALAIVVVVTIKVVGALLITALLIIPAAARPIARTPEMMAVLAAAIGAIAAISGFLGSYLADTPTGPSIVAAAAVMFAAINIAASLHRRLDSSGPSA